MAREEELEIEIDATGQVTVVVSGLKGPACMEYVDVFRRLLGPVTDERPTPEYYETELHSSVGQTISRRGTGI